MTSREWVLVRNEKQEPSHQDEMIYLYVSRYGIPHPFIKDEAPMSMGPTEDISEGQAMVFLQAEQMMESLSLLEVDEQGRVVFKTADAVRDYLSSQSKRQYPAWTGQPVVSSHGDILFDGEDGD